MFAVFFKMIGGIKGVAIIAALLAVGGWAFVQKNNVKKANLARDQAIVQRDAAGVERDKAIAVARVNAATIKQLETEKKLADDSLVALDGLYKASLKRTNTREIIIREQASNPANQVGLSPVLQATVNDILADRAARRGEVK